MFQGVSHSWDVAIQNTTVIQKYLCLFCWMFVFGGSLLWSSMWSSMRLHLRDWPSDWLCVSLVKLVRLVCDHTGGHAASCLALFCFDLEAFPQPIKLFQSETFIVSLWKEDSLSIRGPHTQLPWWPSCKESASSAEDRRSRFDPHVWRIPWRRVWHPTPLLAWRIPWTEEPGGLPVHRFEESGTTEATEYMHTHKPGTDLFSTAAARFRELVSKPSAGVLDTDNADGRRKSLLSSYSNCNGEQRKDG